MQIEVVLQASLDAIDSHLAIVDGTGRVVGVNAAWRRFAAENGGAADAYVGSNYLEVCARATGEDGAYASAVSEAIRAHLAGTCEPSRFTYPCDTPSARLWFDLVIGGAEAADGRRVVVTAHADVTARRALEDRARQSQKAAAVARLAGAVAHEFNNVLTVIACNTEALSSTPSGSSQHQLSELSKAANHAAGLARQLLALSHDTAVTPAPLAVDACLGGLEGALRRLVGEGVTLTLSLGASSAHVAFTGEQLEQVLSSLVTRARVAMSGSGRVLVETALEEERGPSGMLRLRVQDNGPPIPEADLAHVFDPYSRAAGHGDVGLDLAIAYATVERYGGQLGVTNRHGDGTTFDVHLPLAPPPATRVALQPGAEATSGRTILVAEDEPGVRSVVARALARRGFHVLVARNGHDALEIAARHGGTIDLLLTDAIMPGMGGRDLAEALSRTRPSMRLLLMSGFVDDHVLRGEVSAGHVPYLQKPFTLKELVRRVDEALGGAEAGGPSGGGD